MECHEKEQAGLYSVSELISMAFHKDHRVDFKLIHIILLVLARRLNVLNRKVHVNMPGVKRVTSDVFLEEVKVHARRLVPGVPAEGQKKSDYDRDNILVVHTRPGEEEVLKLSRGRIPQSEMKSLATLDLYVNLSEQITKIEKQLKIVNSEVPEWLDKALPISHPKALLQLGARLNRTESNIETLTANLINLASRVTKADKANVEFGNKTQKLIVGYVMVSQNRLKSSRVTESHSRRAPHWETAKVEDDDTRTTRETRITCSKPAPKGVAIKDAFDEAGFRLSGVNLAAKKSITHANDIITKPDLLQNARELKDTIIKIFNENMKKNYQTIKDVKKEYATIMKSHFPLEPIQEAVGELETMLKQCFARQNQLNKDAMELGLHQDKLFDMQQSADEAIDKMQEVIANRKSDVNAINQLHHDMSSLGWDCEVLHIAQKEIALDQRDFCKELKVLLKEILQLNRVKCSRHEFWDALKNKAGLYDLNTFMSSVHFAANYGDLQRILASKVDKFQAREYTWQRQIDEIYIKFHDTVNIDQLNVVNNDSRNKTDLMRKKIDYYIDLVEPFKRSEDPERAKTREEKKCLSCFSSVTEPFYKLPEKRAPEDVNTVCYPSTPVTKDKRCAKNMKPCQKDKEKKDITSAMTISALKIPTVPEEPCPIDTSRSTKNQVHIPCKPCNKFKIAYKAKTLPTQWSWK